MKTLTIICMSLLGADAASADIVHDERIEELVLEPLRANGLFWHVFSRARVLVTDAKLELSTEAPTLDSDEREFVPFRVDNVNESEDGYSLQLTGCYYPHADVAYLWDDFTEAHVPIAEHPLLTRELPDTSVADDGRCVRGRR